MANVNARFHLNKQLVAFNIHPKQTKQHADINRKCRGIMRNQNKTINLLPSYLRMSFSSEVLFPCKINETPEIVEPLLSPNAQLSAS